MAYKYNCEDCDYGTDRLDAYKRHKNKKSPCKKLTTISNTPVNTVVEEPTNPLQCPCCDKLFSTKYYAKKHIDEKKCMRPPSLQCPTCKEMFTNAIEKHKHKMSGVCVLDADTIAKHNVVENITNTINTNCHTNNGTINNNIVNNIIDSTTLLDFMKTNCQIVINDIAKNPAYLQLAYQQGLLDEAVIDLTHYSGAMANRNVYGIEKKGTNMHVAINGIKLSMNKKVGIAQSIHHVQTIANNPKVQPYLTTYPELPIKTPASVKEEKMLFRKYSEIYSRKGNYSHNIVIPPLPTMIISDEDVELCFIDVIRSSSESPCRQSTEYYKEVALLVAREYYFMPATESSTEKWFKFLGEGWELCKCDAKIVKTINEKMTDLKNNTRVRLSKLPEDTCVEERYLDYFPSMRIAAETMKWICEASEESIVNQISIDEPPPPVIME